MSSRTLERIREAMPVAMDPRIQARRDEVDRQRQRRRRLWLAGAAAVVAVIALVWFVTHSALLDVDHIRATATTHVSEQDLLDASGLHPGDRLVDVDPGAVRNRLLALPWVQDATVDVDWWGTVNLAVSERTPVAAISDGAGAFVLADASGRALTTLPVGADLGGAIIVDGIAPVAPGERFGPGLDAPLEVIAALDTGRAHPGDLRGAGPRRLDRPACPPAGERGAVPARPAGRQDPGSADRVRPRRRRRAEDAERVRAVRSADHPMTGRRGMVDPAPERPLHYQARPEVDITLDHRSRVSRRDVDA